MKDILDYYTKRNGSKHYAGRLFARLKAHLKDIQNGLRSGSRTETGSLRLFSVDNVVVFFETHEDHVEIHDVMDARRYQETVQ
ncbi:MAG TPA: hypothetical protein DEB39_06895 [Planctomycetaceae bacterium]|nr:hypothetical protein [Planctomycetaceae bacterium]